MKVVEQFISVNGEGKKAGQLAYFIRFAGCNLSCAYCDTAWANKHDVDYIELSPKELLTQILDSGVTNITLTGGEPLLQPEMKTLLRLLRAEHSLRVEIETNGSIDIEPFFMTQEEQMLMCTLHTHHPYDYDNVSFTVDYKTGVSRMENEMKLSNYRKLRSYDTVKFVVGSVADLDKAREVIEEYRLVDKQCSVFLSPCFGAIEPVEIVEYLVKHRLNRVNIQLQLHKYIWDPNQKGV